jgi:hypothetical protein
VIDDNTDIKVKYCFDKACQEDKKFDFTGKAKESCGKYNKKMEIFDFERENLVY